jgi:hypothetical protein
MSSKLRLLPLFVLVFAALAFVACGGSSESTQPPSAPTEGAANANDNAADDDLFVSNGAEVLGRSSAAFASDDVHSFTGALHMSFQLGTTGFDQSATFASQDDDFYMEMTIGGGEDASGFGELFSALGDTKLLARDGTVYMYFFGAWLSVSPSDVGADEQDLEDLLDSGSLVD